MLPNYWFWLLGLPAASHNLDAAALFLAWATSPEVSLDAGRKTGSPLARAKEAPGRGFHWGMATFHPSLPRGTRVSTKQDGTMEEILLGPAQENDGTFNLMGALKTSMATCGYEDIRSFQRAEVMVAPALMSEGKKLQNEQHVGMGSNGRAAVAAGVAVSDD